VPPPVIGAGSSIEHPEAAQIVVHGLLISVEIGIEQPLGLRAPSLVGAGIQIRCGVEEDREPTEVIGPQVDVQVIHRTELTLGMIGKE
jgi:hypothetical protein